MRQSELKRLVIRADFFMRSKVIAELQHFIDLWVSFQADMNFVCSDAIDVAFKGVPDPESDGTLHESLAYSASVNATSLLTQFGVPDEARRLF